MSNFEQNVLPKARIYIQKMNEYLKLYVEGKLEMFPDDKHWPDANSTLRITYGKIEGSSPTDGMRYTEHTNTDGIIQKYNCKSSNITGKS